MDQNESNRTLTTPPRELTGPVPRKVTHSPGNATYLAIASVLMLVVFAGPFAVFEGPEAIEQMRERSVLRRDSREVVGQVTGVSDGDYGTPGTVKYSFTVDGKTYLAEADKPRSAGPWSRFRRSSPILVRFMPSDPAISHPAGWEWSPLMYWDDIAWWILWVALAGIGVGSLAKGRELAREGKAAEGVVTSCTPKNREFRVEYEFRTEDGESLEGKCDSEDAYKEGAKIWVLYLARKPKRNRPYPLDDWLVVS